MDLLEFKREFQLANAIASKFSDANGATGLDDDEFKRCFFKAMPLKWTDSFHAAGKDEDELSFDDIYKHMNNIEKLEDKFSKKSGAGSTRLSSNNGSSNGSKRQQGNSGRRNRGRGRGPSSNSGSNSHTRSNQGC